MRKLRCPNRNCREKNGSGQTFHKHGYYVTRWNHQPVPRYRCRACGVSFSTHTFLATYRQKKPYLNQEILKWYASDATQRRMAINLNVNRKTVVRKFLFLALQARRHHKRWLKTYTAHRVQLDEMESFEHTRLKPLTIALAVSDEPRKILNVAVASIPYKGKLAAVARKKYGVRPNHRQRALRRCLKQIARCVPTRVRVVTDQSPFYAFAVGRYLPHAQHAPQPPPPHRQLPHRPNVDDPLQALNHIASRIRHDLSRMGRQVWTTTKKPSRLKAHLDLFIAYYNRYPIAA